MRGCATLGITQAFTNYNYPNGNADAERTMRTIKEELFWLCEWSSLEHPNNALYGRKHTTCISRLVKNWKDSPLKAAWFVGGHYNGRSMFLPRGACDTSKGSVQHFAGKTSY